MSCQNKNLNKNPEVSVIIPLYNEEKYVDDAINSVLNQTYQDFEIIVVDDESTDNSRLVIKNFNDPRIKYFYKKNSGPNLSRNYGIERAQGELIAFLDADDIWTPHKLEIQVKKIKEDPNIGLVFGWVYYIDSNSNLTGQTRYDIDKDYYINILLGNYVDNGSTPLIRKTCFDKVGFFKNMQPAGDWDMWIRIAKEYDFANVKDYIAMYRIHSQGISKKYKKMEKHLFQILDREFNTNDPKLLSIKQKAYSYRYKYLSGVCRNLLQNKDALSYIIKAIKTYPPLLFEKATFREIFKLFVVVSIPKPFIQFVKDFFNSFSYQT